MYSRHHRSAFRPDRRLTAYAPKAGGETCETCGAKRCAYCNTQMPQTNTHCVMSETIRPSCCIQRTSCGTHGTAPRTLCTRFTSHRSPSTTLLALGTTPCTRDRRSDLRGDTVSPSRSAIITTVATPGARPTTWLTRPTRRFSQSPRLALAKYRSCRHPPRALRPTTRETQSAPRHRLPFTRTTLSGSRAVLGARSLFLEQPPSIPIQPADDSSTPSAISTGEAATLAAQRQ